MNIHERLNAFWSGDRPHPIPYTIYWWEWRHYADDPAWGPLFKAGLGYTKHIAPVVEVAPEVQVIEDSYRESGDIFDRVTWRTPVGEVYATWAYGWNRKFWLDTREDYQVMTWIVEHTRLEPAFDAFLSEQASIMPYGIALSYAGRTPMQRILVDFAGLENFAMHLYDFETEVLGLYEALLKQFRRRIQLVAEGPGRFVSVLENFTAETMGPARFRCFHMPVYAEYFPLLHSAGKIVGVHYDGRLDACRSLIAQSPIDLIESFTTPPEGDMSLTAARAAWPEKLLWNNINIGTYQLPWEQLFRKVQEMAQQGSAGGARLAFEVSEHLPRHWQQVMPVVLEALRTL